MIESSKPTTKGRRTAVYAGALLVALGAAVLWWLSGREAPVAGVTPLIEAPMEDPGTLGLVSAERQDPTGTINVLCVFAQFADEAHRGHGIPSFAADLFDPDRPGSFTHFYDTMSDGQLEVHGTVLPRRYTSSRPAAAYQAATPNQWGRYAEFVQDLLAQVDADVDLAQFDNDGPDGVPNSGDDDTAVDWVFINLRSTPRGFIIGGANGRAGLGHNYRSADPSAEGRPIVVRGRRYNGALLGEGTFAQTVGVMAHEFGHGLGLPDLYDLDPLDQADLDPADDSAGIGRWGLMGLGAHGWTGGDGPSPMDAWSREQLGWLGRDNEGLVETVPSALGWPLTDVDSGGRVYKVWLEDGGGDVADEEREYLLLECRSRASNLYNRQLPADGVLVWHVRPLAGDNRDEGYKLVDLVCADGRYRDAGYPVGTVPDPQEGGDNLDFWAHDAAYARRHEGNDGDSTDLFRAEQTETLRIYPGDGRQEPVLLRVDGTREPMVAFVSYDGQTATAVTAGLDDGAPDQVRLLPNVPNPFNPQTTIRFQLPATAQVRLSVFNPLGQRIRTLVDDLEDAGDHELTWDSRDDDGRSVASGVYHARLEVEGSHPQVLAMTVLR